MQTREPLATLTCSYCLSPARYQGTERNSRGKGTKYACTEHKHLINVVAEYSPSRRKPTEQANQAGLF